MAVIEISAEIKGEAKTQALLGVNHFASAQCFGRASAARPPQVPAQPPPPKSG